MEYNNLIEPSLHKYVTVRGDVQVAGEMIDGLELFFPPWRVLFCHVI